MQCRYLVSAAVGLVLLAGSGQAETSTYSRWPKVRLAGFSVGAGAGFSHFGAGAYPFFGAYGGYGFGPFYGGPWLYGDPFYGSLFPPAYFYDATLGKVKLKDLNESASVFVDGGFAGNAGKLRSMWVEPGAHNLRITDGNRSFDERIYVLTGRTLTVTPELTEGSHQ